MDFKGIKNITLSADLSNIYGNTDGLSLQNLFYARNCYFPNCFLFNYEARTNGDYKFDTQNLLQRLVEKYNDSKSIEIVRYYTKTLGAKDENDLTLGFCFIIPIFNIYARIEESVTESYILYDNEHPCEFNAFLETVLEYYVAPDEEENIFWRICSSPSGYYLEKGKLKCPENFDIQTLYNDDFEKENSKILNFIATEDKSGLVILHGEKGTGKSSYIKHLVNKFLNKKFVYVPASLVQLLGDPSFGSFLQSLDNHIIVLEDCENAIKDRKTSGTASAVSLLLNMTDGILSDDLGIKFICTFNADMKDIDPALLRKGRLVSKYEFKALNTEKSQKILNDLGIEATVTKPLTLAEIFNYNDDNYEIEKKSII